MKNNILPQLLVEKGRQLYYHLKPELEKKHLPTDYVSFEVQSGNYFVGKTPLDALKKAKEKYPRKKFFLAQVGSIAGILK